MTDFFKIPIAGSALMLCALLYVPGSIRAEEEDAGDPPEVAVGERLFLETRFAQYFFARNIGVNTPLENGDPSVAMLKTSTGFIQSPFANQSMNCRQCHLVDDAKTFQGGGNRSYSDFARRSPIPAREDGRTHTPRNSPSLVNAQLQRRIGFFLHFDAEFPTIRDLVKATLTGRNYGWLANERAVAVSHIARVIRDDDGTGALAKSFGGAYRTVFNAENPRIPAELRLPVKFRLDVKKASDEQILSAVATLIAAYVNQLQFANTSPYDCFLIKNGLPRQPIKREPPIAYGRRLLKEIDKLKSPKFVTPADGTFALHSQTFEFGAAELAGLRLFLSEPAAASSSSTGNCIACHAPPLFTDFAFHNTGAAQEEYDAIHGSGKFLVLNIPSQTERLANPHEFLPPSPADPAALGRFISIPSAADPVRTDLGVWNVIGNPNKPAPQRTLAKALLRPGEKRVELGALVDRSVAVFKTPGLRDLGHSAPYLHTGRKDSLGDVIRFYEAFATLNRAGLVRNPDPEIAKIQIQESDVDALVRFLKSLNEDYE